MHKAAKYFLFVLIACYMYGAMIFKYVSGAESLSEGISYTFTGNKDQYDDDFHFYYICIFAFSAISIFFSLGNIENSKVLQVVTMYLRFFTTLLMITGSVISIIFHDGITFEIDDTVPDFKFASNLFANSVFVYVMHHSMAGIVKPVRPQKSIFNVVYYSFLSGSGILILEAVLASLAFSHIRNTD